MEKNSITLLKYRRKLVWLAALLVSLLLFLPAACSWSHLPAESASSQTQPLPCLASQGQAAVTPAPSRGANPESSSSQTSSSSDILPHGKLAGAQSPVICESTAGAGPTGETGSSCKAVTSEPTKTCVTTTKATTKATTKTATSKTTTAKTTQAKAHQTTTAATSTAKTEPAPTSSTSQASQDPVQAMFSATNAFRQKNGLAPLKNGSQAMATAAAERAQDLAVSFSHNRPDGSSFSTALKSCGVSYTCAAENIANFPAASQVSQVLAAWEGSAGHRANMLRTDMTCLSIGFYSHDGRHYWVQIFTNS